jgi:hypothetical protein
MTISNFRSAEPLYIVVIRQNNAESLLRAWARASQVQTTIENNRMKIFDNRTLSVFQMSWSHDWDQVTIWDCWNKRHIYHD